MSKPIRLAVIGTGGMAHAHARAFQKLKGQVELAACFDLDPKRAAKYAADFKIPRVYDDLGKMLKEEPLDAVTNVTPDNVHAKVAIAAARAGLHILSEKPLATSVAEGNRMAEAVRKAGVVNMVNFSYRNSSALQEAARLIARGKIGRVMQVEASYLQSWLSSKVWGDWKTSPHWLWRLSTAHGSEGVLGDLGCHLYDATCLLAGPIEEMHCTLKTFDKGVKNGRVGEYMLDANDSFATTATFANGAIGVLHSSRWTTGHTNSLRFRIYGDEGAVEVDLDTSYDTYRICAGKRDRDKAAWKTVKARPTLNNYARFLKAIRTGKPDPSDFDNGLRVQKYLAASIASDKKRRPVQVG